jgi:hypothetical protein
MPLGPAATPLLRLQDHTESQFQISEGSLRSYVSVKCAHPPLSRTSSRPAPPTPGSTKHPLAHRHQRPHTRPRDRSRRCSSSSDSDLRPCQRPRWTRPQGPFSCPWTSPVTAHERDHASWGSSSAPAGKIGQPLSLWTRAHRSRSSAHNPSAASVWEYSVDKSKRTRLARPSPGGSAGSRDLLPP